MSKIQKNHVVKLADGGERRGVVKWVGRDAVAEKALVMWDEGPRLGLYLARDLEVVVIELSAEKRIVRDATHTSSTEEKK